ncbi:MAG TPA: hypothetical protein VIW01_05125 [Dehalococcoidia bacterium]
MPREDLLDVIECEIDRRPEAPVIADLEPHFIDISREQEALTVGFAPEARETLQAFVEAERQCCAGIGWFVSDGPRVSLRIEAGPQALDALAMLFESKDIEKAR